MLFLICLLELDVYQISKMFCTFIKSCSLLSKKITQAKAYATLFHFHMQTFAAAIHGVGLRDVMSL